MRCACLIGALAITGACAATPETNIDEQTVRDYVEVGELDDVQHIRVSTRDSWSNLGEYFVIYKTRSGDYLVEFRRRCPEVNDAGMIPGDHRYDQNRLRANQDTLRGCRIGKIYPLTEAQAAELRNLGKGPVQGN